MKAVFRHVAALSSVVIGTARAFAFALVLVVGLVALGGFSGYSDHWLAVFSAVLSAVTFLLVFLLQYRENRDTVAVQLKLNELLRAVEGAREQEFLDLEDRAEDEQEHASREFRESVLERH